MVCSSAEVRGIAGMSQDPALNKIFAEGKDIYMTVLEQAYPGVPYDELKKKRKRFKSVVLGIFYGRGDMSISTAEHLPIEEVHELTELFFGQFTEVKKLIQKCREYTIANGAALTGLGDYIWLDKNRAHTVAFNTVVQSFAAITLAETFYNNVRKLREAGIPTSIISVVHDSNQLRIKIKDILQALLGVEKFFKKYFKEVYNLDYAYDIDILLNLRDALKFNWNQETGEIKIAGIAEQVDFLANTMMKYYDIEKVSEELDKKGKCSFYAELAKWRWKSHRIYFENDFKEPDEKSVVLKLNTPISELHKNIDKVSNGEIFYKDRVPMKFE